MNRRYLPIFDFIRTSREIRLLINELNKITPCAGYVDDKPIFADYVYCYEKQEGKRDICIKAFINYQRVDQNEKMLDASIELFHQRIWFTCDNDFKCSALAAIVPEYREAIVVNLNHPCFVFHSSDIPTLSHFK